MSKNEIRWNSLTQICKPKITFATTSIPRQIFSKTSTATKKISVLVSHSPLSSSFVVVFFLQFDATSSVWYVCLRTSFSYAFHRLGLSFLCAPCLFHVLFMFFYPLFCAAFIFAKLIQLNYVNRRRIHSEFLSFSFKAKNERARPPFFSHILSPFVAVEGRLVRKFQEYAVASIANRLLSLISLRFIRFDFARSLSCPRRSRSQPRTVFVCPVLCISFLFFTRLGCARVWYFWVYRCRCFCYFWLWMCHLQFFPFLHAHQASTFDGNVPHFWFPLDLWNFNHRCIGCLSETCKTSKRRVRIQMGFRIVASFRLFRCLSSSLESLYRWTRKMPSQQLSAVLFLWMNRVEYGFSCSFRAWIN